MKELLPLIAVTISAVGAQPGGCNAPAPSPSVTIPLETSPFMALSSPDGCWLFVSGVGGSGGKTGVVVLRRDAGAVRVDRLAPLPSDGATGMALTHDGKLLVVTAGASVIFLDVARLISGKGEPLVGSLSDGARAGSVYAAITADDKLLFVSDEWQQSITVIDLARARSVGYTAAAIVGRIAVGMSPVGLVFSPDGNWLYTTSEAAPPAWNWARTCGGPEGAVIVVNVARAATDPAHAVVARVPAGCSPVRAAVSPNGARLYVTARASYALVVFDTAKLLSGAAHAQLAKFYMGPAPVPVAVIDGGKKVLVGNSNRLAESPEPQSLSVIDAARIGEGEAAVVGSIPAGSFPREMAVSSDGRTLFLTNYTSRTLQVIDLDRLPMTAAGH